MAPHHATLVRLVLGGEDAVHGARGTEVASLVVEQGGVHLGRSQVGEARLVQDVEHRLLLGRRERPR
jgi:hypothetical protein